MIPLHDDNPVSITPYVTYILIASCVLVFIWELSLAGQLQAVFYSLGVVPAVLIGDGLLPPEVALIPAWLSIFSICYKF